MYPSYVKVDQRPIDSSDRYGTVRAPGTVVPPCTDVEYRKHTGITLDRCTTDVVHHCKSAYIRQFMDSRYRQTIAVDDRYPSYYPLFTSVFTATGCRSQRFSVFPTVHRHGRWTRPLSVDYVHQLCISVKQSIIDHILPTLRSSTYQTARISWRRQ